MARYHCPICLEPHDVNSSSLLRRLTTDQLFKLAEAQCQLPWASRNTPRDYMKDRVCPACVEAAMQLAFA